MMTDQDSSIKKEVVMKGVAAAPGIAIGHVYLFKKVVPVVEAWDLGDNEFGHELERLDRAVAKSEKELNKILAFAQQKIGDAKAKIFEAQIMVLQDQVLLDAIRKRIRTEKKNAEHIVNDEIGKYARLMLAAHDDYMHERAHDVDDLKNRIVRNLQQEKLFSRLDESAVIVAHNLTPADTMILSRNNVLGYATDLGGVTSHAALLSRALKIPAAVGLGEASRSVVTGDLAILDGYSGTITIHPSQESLEAAERKREQFLEFESKLVELKNLPATTTDGHTVELSANIEFQEEIEYVVVQGSQGIGLYRSESILLDRDDFPSEEEQYREYKKIAGHIYPNRVIMRTFDVGGDKIAPEMAEEANPFLGWRGIRMMLDRPDLFLDQLRAMLRASTRKNIAIMFPMVTTIQEVYKAKELVEQAKAELQAKKIKFDAKIQIGVMIEVPAAALTAGEIAAEVDFLSIGSNDLTQYLLAIDRGNNLVADLYQELNPVVLRTLKHIIGGGHKHKKWVGICGEMASTPLAVPVLLGLGIDELSVIPSMLPEIKKIIRSTSYKEAQELAHKALTFASASEVESTARAFMKSNCPDIPLDDKNNIQ
jgi:phosphotransferase system enzyme I (PtsI)